MRDDCECSYCKNGVDEYFCSKCFYNFNKCESFHESEGITLCPRCHPQEWWDTIEGDYRESMQAWNKFYQDAQHGIVNHQKCEEGTWKIDLSGGKDESKR